MLSSSIAASVERTQYHSVLPKLTTPAEGHIRGWVPSIPRCAVHRHRQSLARSVIKRRVILTFWPWHLSFVIIKIGKIDRVQSQDPLEECQDSNQDSHRSLGG